MNNKEIARHLKDMDYAYRSLKLSYMRELERLEAENQRLQDIVDEGRNCITKPKSETDT